MSLGALYKRYEHHINTAAFLCGFIFDSFAFAHVDHAIIRGVLLMWLCVAGVGIIIHAKVKVDFERESFFGQIADWFAGFLPFVIQFAFGSVLSGTLIFFSHSGSFSVSWPFLLIIIAFIVGNEIFRGRYSELAFQMVSFFVAVFLYSTLVVPLLLNDVGSTSFIVSGAVSLFAYFVLSRIIGRFAPEKYVVSRWVGRMGVLGFYLLFNILYFNNLVPPLPLALEEIGIYHQLLKKPNGEYLLGYEPAGMFSWGTINNTFHIEEGKPAYAFSAVYAPEGIKTTISHRWLYYNESTKSWILYYTSSFPILGGRIGGYRGYSVKENIIPGKWRVEVTTEGGRLIGETNFIAAPLEKKLKLETLVR